ncbi:Na+/H+ antiporter NhaC family protein [Alienimonas californiensis]|uniref:Malate-2H(+)/Na(+)-lactate antiporter n=1 Tax=Alienimonas californiensis TaxID=2527989 RepID=A0A517P5S8_9PLAN|nr:Na+/H+ antiporter NhaC family protein [Alienimonas californiensis]QDT14727.1 Malate-2H(+)/Na(+)-lactate antiporter [Alienimonas californiensis]
MTRTHPPPGDAAAKPVPVVEEAAVGPVEPPAVPAAVAKRLRPSHLLAAVVLLGGLAAGVFVYSQVAPQWREQKTTFNVYQNESGELAYRYSGEELPVGEVVPYDTSPLRAEALADLSGEPPLERQWVVETSVESKAESSGEGDAAGVRYSLLEPGRHYGLWSLLPAAIAVGLCLLTKEPLSALLGSVVVGALMLGRFDITDAVLLPSLASKSAATVLLLYLWLLGGLMGVWSRTGAAQAFAEFMTRRFVRGPRTAKLVAWLLGVLFFQGGTVSVVLVGTIVKPVADRERVSHEELSYIVDSTASPIAAVLAFNAWPVYVQALIFVPGVSFLATEDDRIAFFFKSVPFSFYALLAIAGTFLLSLDYTRFSGRGIRAAMQRARTTGQLDAPGVSPLSSEELAATRVPPGYRPHVLEFFVPFLLLVGVAVGTFVATGSPKVNWAFGAAFLASALTALFKGMSLGALIEGVGDGLKGVVLASVVLMLAVTVGGVSREVGAGVYLVESLGERIPAAALPVALQLITMVIAFSTGTSWGTFAVAFPLAMPLAWQVAGAGDVTNPELFMSICFATVLNGSVFGDQCSPISDTTILSAMTTGCDLMDHVKTQLVPASLAAAIAAALWTATVVLFA